MSVLDWSGEQAFESAWHSFWKVRKEHVSNMASLDNSQIADKLKQ
jgi:hypothetical protein